uniref:Cytochrome c oxidase subunit 2 n=1 Tax=Scolytinae sp. 6 ACP-2013 TaxID=1434579 RepID=A0A3G3ME98_9CUCU|nr:cytochrome c oxidase subunit 2 [Scolytinae sp. 6 ACP-2013]
MATWKTLLFQDSSSPLMEQLIYFHDHTLTILIIITILILQLLIYIYINKFLFRFLLEGQMIELIWTILPTFILLLIAFPSLRLLYSLDEINSPMLTIKITGHQWYWNYEYSDYKQIQFDSYMIPIENMKMFNFRLLDVDNHLVIPINSQIRLLITSTDVIHSWTIPSLSVKIDGTPGRLNQTNFITNRISLMYGQCSEICGANHSFMPILIETSSINNFIKWIIKY